MVGRKLEGEIINEFKKGDLAQGDDSSQEEAPTEQAPNKVQQVEQVNPLNTPTLDDITEQV